MKKESILKPKPLVVALLVVGGLSNVQAATQLESVSIEGQNSHEKRDKMVKLKDAIIHTEVVTQEKIEKKQAASLAQAIENEPGVKVSTECSMCGVKRVMLNGLKGEHTTLMTNGVPNSSIMEGFYGFDAIPMAGVSTVEVARGAGASLIAPEAIGGVVNVVTVKPREDGFAVDISRGNQDYHKYQFSANKLSDDKRTAISVSAQSDFRGQVDEDNNWVNESPELDNRVLTAQIWHELDDTNRFDIRIEDQKSEVFGGPVVGSGFVSSHSEARVSAEGDAEFIGGNVGNRPDENTQPRDFLENIISTKQSISGKWLHDVSPDLQTQMTASYVDATMDTIYEGITYKADQEILYTDIRADYFATDQHALTFGVDFKQDDYQSASTGGTMQAKDSYDLKTSGAYIRDIWTVDAGLEVALALRADNVNVDFTDQEGLDFSETLLAPRVHIRYDHNFSLTSRFSAGKGYLVPLAFFETDHGIVDDGFAVAVDKLEKSDSFHYSLAYSGVTTSFEAGYSWTQVDNLAKLEIINDTSTLVNSDGTGTVQHADITGTLQLGQHWTVGATAEVFMYDTMYRESFGVIPVEERVRFMADYMGHGLEFNTTVTWVGSRNYSDYSDAGYNEHFYDKANTLSKGEKSPDYFTVDMKISRQLDTNWKLYAGVNNLLDYTQTGEGDSPLFYDTDGAVDVTHIWGPLRGRFVYAGINAKF